MRITSDAAPDAGGWTEQAHFAWSSAARDEGAFVFRTAGFNTDTKSFVGSGDQQRSCPSTNTAAHEIGHSVENFLERAAQRKKHKANDDVNVAIRAFNAAVATRTLRMDVAEATVFRMQGEAVRAYNAQILRRPRNVEAEQRLLGPATELPEFDGLWGRARNSMTTASNVLQNKLGLPTVSRVAVTDYSAAVNGAARLLSDEVAAHAPGVAALVRSHVDTLQQGYLSVVASAEQYCDARVALAAADAEVGRVTVPAGGDKRISKRRDQFTKMVQALPEAARTRVIGITPYSKQEWPDKPGELFAEAYALWLTDRPFLQQTAPELADYFNHGRHLQ